jgi:tetratricopeptide (TPR) repeat protein
MRRIAVALAMITALAVVSSAMAQAPSSSSCQNMAPSSAVKDARAQLERDPSVLDVRFKLADALTLQQCYEEAVQVLEAGEVLHPENAALEVKLRNARSMMGEQRYIESMTRAEEGARLQRNILRCKKLGDIAACDEALSARRNDWELLIAKGDSLVQKNRGAEALPVYMRAAELGAGNAALQAKIASLEALRQANVATMSKPDPISRVEPSPAKPVLAAAAKPKAIVYSNEAPAGRSN